MFKTLGMAHKELWDETGLEGLRAINYTDYTTILILK